MNRKDLHVFLEDTRLITDYSNGTITRTVIDDYTHKITFTLRNGQVSYIDISNHDAIDIGYLKQFGVSVTSSGEFFFIQSWEKGLFCFMLQSGELVWQSKRNRAYELVVLEDSVVCRFWGQCVEVINISSGDIVSHYPLGYGTTFLPIDDMHFLAGPKRSAYRILDINLEEEKQISASQMNPNQFDTFLITDVEFAEKGIRICGSEYSTVAMRQAIHDHRVDEFLSTAFFSRYISLA